MLDYYKRHYESDRLLQILSVENVHVSTTTRNTVESSCDKNEPTNKPRL